MRNADMLFSVLVPVYNSINYLRECIAAILAQTEQDFEIVLVNDGSNDRSGDMCDQLADVHPGKIRAIHHDENKGLLMARRTLFSNAAGEWLICVDADDILHSNALRTIRKAVENNTCDLIIFDAICNKLDNSKERFTLSLQSNKIYSGKEKIDIYRLRTETYQLNSLCTKAIHHSLIDKDVDYNQWKSIRTGEDIFQLLPILDAAKSILYLQQPLYTYNKTYGSITYRISPTIYEQRRILWERDDLYFDKWRLERADVQKARISRINMIISYVSNMKTLVKDQARYVLFSDYVHKIQKDGYLEKQYRLIDINQLRFRYRIYCKLIFSNSPKLLAYLMGLENLARQCKQKFSK
jgi:glycosyltransferase involved in cell wall biosynthesis